MSINKIDPGLEFFGFGGPSDQEEKYDSVFGDMTYYKSGNYWWAPKFWHPGDNFYKLDGKVVWSGTYVYHPINSSKQDVASKFKYIFSIRSNFEKLLTIIGEAINYNEEKSGVFNASCNIQDIVAGKDNRFVCLWLDVDYDTYLKQDVAVLAVAFNKRIFYLFFTSEYKIFSYVPETPALYKANVEAKSLDKNIKDPDLRKVSFVKIAKEGFISPYNETRKLLEEQISDYIEGEYDSEDTDVSINSPNPNDSNTDVDIRIDMTPEREQVLLKAYNYNTKLELETYGIEGLSYKFNKLNTSLEDLFTKLYNDHKENSIKVSNLQDDNVKLGIEHIDTDILSKEKFVENIKDASTTVFNNFKMLKNLVETSSVQVSNSINTSFELTEEKIYAPSANFANKDDIIFISNELTKSKVNVNLSQIKFYTNKLIEKMNTTKFTEDEHNAIDTILNNLNTSMITLASYVSQGKRFIDEVIIKCN